MQQISTCLWFENEAEEAINFYVSVLGGSSRILHVQRYTEAGPGEPGTVLTIDCELAGHRVQALNGGMDIPFTEAVSLSVRCEGQAEVDRLWEGLTADGGKEVECGWLTDKYGLSWQIVPTKLPELLNDPDPARAERVMKAMLGMRKIDVQGLVDAAG